MVAVYRLLLAVTSAVTVPGSGVPGFSSCGAQASLLLSMWNLSRDKSMPPELAGGFLTTGRPGKSQVAYLNAYIQVLFCILNVTCIWGFSSNDDRIY